MDATDDEMVAGYRDGRADDRDTLPLTLTNRSAAYIHGWLNGRDDRLKQPRQSVAAAQARADAIKRYAERGIYAA
ncbi:MAG: hypothetical protein JWM16_6372 [Verrucomicrobiales bacterium]|nr:hypothetical protein [Verrucomicrobiales bacterium]